MHQSPLLEFYDSFSREQESPGRCYAPGDAKRLTEETWQSNLLSNSGTEVELTTTPSGEKAREATLLSFPNP